MTDHKKEAERLIDRLMIESNRGRDIDSTTSEIYARAALLAHIERGRVHFLAESARYKVSGNAVRGLPSELNGRWVALVAADDDCHLKFSAAPAAPVCYPQAEIMDNNGRAPAAPDQSDSAMLDFLDAKGGNWLARDSVTGRGYRLHQDPAGLYPSARAALRAAMDGAGFAVKPAAATVPAEVPMPEPLYIYHPEDEEASGDLFDYKEFGPVDSDCDSCIRLYGHADVRKYGDAREAAGYARGLKNAEQPTIAEKVQCIHCGGENWIMDGKAPCQITEEDKAAAQKGGER